MAQTMVPIYTIPNTYRVPQSLWESLCRIIPGITRTSGSELCSVQLVAPNNTPVEQPDTASSAGDTGDPGVRAAKLDNQPASASKSSRKKKTGQEPQQGKILLGIPLTRSVWVSSAEFQNLPTGVLADDSNLPEAQPQGTSTPIKVTPVPERHLSGKKVNVTKVKVAHLLFDMQDWQERARKKAEAESQAAASDRTSGGKRSSGGGLPHGFPVTWRNLPEVERVPTVPSEAPKQGSKHPHDDDDEITELPDEGELPVPPKKKKKNEGFLWGVDVYF